MRAGDVVAGRFELTRLAGAGGMARVYRALDRQTGSVVALKVLHTDDVDDVGRFMREAKVLADLSHPGVVRYLAHGSAPDAPRFIAMEWLEGEDLGDRLGSGRLEIAEAVQLGARVGEALGVAHRRGIVHRDIKPSNLFLPDGDIERVKILDFGIARVADVTRRLTRSGMTMGTPGYMSPEQARGEHDIDARSDVFALGCVLYECLLGQPAFAAGHAVAVLGRILFEDPPFLRTRRPEVSADLDALVAQMLAKDPAQRLQDGSAVAQAFAALTKPGGEPAAEAPRRSLGRAEQRIVSVVLAATGAKGNLNETLPWSTIQDGGPATRVDRPRDPTPDSAPPLAGPATLGERHPAGLVAPLRAAAYAQGGRVELLADGTVVALLPGSGTPTEQAARAARCALAMRKSLPGIPMVLATGRGVIDERYPVGEVIDRAARSLDKCSGDSIRMDDVTAGLLDARFDVLREASGAELRGEREDGEGWRTLLGKQTPCVGRDRELSMIMAAWKECVSEPAAAAVLVTGPAGAGKTRIAFEFMKRVALEGKKVRVVVHRADPQAAGSPFGMIAPATRRLAGILDGEPLSVSRRKLHGLIAKRVPPERASHVATFLGELVGVPYDAPDATAEPASTKAWAELVAAKGDAVLMGDQMRAAWVEWAAAVCAVEPLLLVYEDLQWGDLPTVQLIDAGLRALRDAPLMVLALARPDVHERFPRLWPDRNVVAVQLGALSRRAAEKLVRAVLGEGPNNERVETIVERADGNALYLEELIRATAEGKQELPTSVLGMVQARFDALEPEARRALRAASVFGRTFWRGGVAALVGSERSAVALDEWLDDLVRRELVTREPSASLSDEVEYAFRHDLVRDAAYAMLTEADCTLGHRLAGDWLESKGERNPLALALHFERGGELGRAVDAYRLAAEEAFEASDLDAAIARAERGVKCGASGELLGALLLVQAEAYGWKGEFEAAEGKSELAAQYLQRGDPAWYRAVAEIVYVSAPLRKKDELGAWADRLRTTRPTGPWAAGPRVAALCRVAVQLVLVGLNERAVDLLGAAQTAAAALVPRDPMVDARLHQAVAFSAAGAGELETALAEYVKAAESFERAGAVRNRSFLMTQASFILLELGQYARAETVLRDALAIAEKAGIRYNVALARTNLSFALMRQGRLDDALKSGSHAVASVTALVDRRIDAVSRGYLAELLLAGGDIAGAEREARTSVMALGAFPRFCARAKGTLAQALLARGRADEALIAAREGMELLASHGTLTGESLLRLVYARALATTGDAEGAREALRVACARLTARAAALGDPEVRRAFLERVPENAETFALAASSGAV